MPEDAPHGVSATEDAGFSRRPRATMATFIHVHVLLVPSTLVLPEQSPVAAQAPVRWRGLARAPPHFG
jgi:hypothetical protein